MSREVNEGANECMNICWLNEWTAEWMRWKNWRKFKGKKWICKQVNAWMNERLQITTELMNN